MKKQKALVTGGSGFIGNHLIRTLQKLGYQVSSLDRSGQKIENVTIFEGDIRDGKLVKAAMKNQDVVYHLAGLLGTSELQSKVHEAVEVNILGAVNVFSEAVSQKTHVVLISKPNPWLNAYSITKESSEKFCALYEKEFGLKATIVKWFSVYGPGQKYSGVQKAVPTFIVAALKNKPLPIFGTGRQEADFIYVTDTVSATVSIARNKRSIGKTVEIGSGKGTRVIDLAKMIIKCANSRSSIKYFPMRSGEAKQSAVVANLSELTQLIPFKPEVFLPDGIRVTIDYYRTQLFKK